MGDAYSDQARHDEAEEEARLTQVRPGCVRIQRWITAGKRQTAQGRLIEVVEIDRRRNRVLLELEFDRPRGVVDNPA